MRMFLEVAKTPDGVLEGSAHWGAGSAHATFHGILELVALVETALDADLLRAQHQPGPPLAR